MKNNKIKSLVLVYSLIQAVTNFACDAGEHVPTNAQSRDANRQILRLNMKREGGAVLGCLTAGLTVASAALTYSLATTPSQDPRQTLTTALAGLNTTVWGLVTAHHAWNFRRSHSLLSSIQKDSKKN